jgi:hypothetical protein
MLAQARRLDVVREWPPVLTLGVAITIVLQLLVRARKRGGSAPGPEYLSDRTLTTALSTTGIAVV